MNDVYHSIRQSEKGVWISIASYIILSSIKIIIGFSADSKALTADGFNNITDILASIAVLVGLRISRKPPDLDHPYGHFRAETISALVASFIMASVGIQVLYHAATSFFSTESFEAPNILAAWVSVGSAVCMYAVYIFNRKLSERMNNLALKAAAQDNRSDAFVSIGVAIGIIGTQFGLPWLDPIAAFIVGLIICKTAWDIFHQSSHNLTDGFDESRLESLRRTTANTPGVRDVKDIKARTHGSQVLVDIIVMVDPQLSLAESHEISDEVEKRMHKKHGINHSHVHVEPWIKPNEQSTLKQGDH